MEKLTGKLESDPIPNLENKGNSIQEVVEKILPLLDGLSVQNIECILIVVQQRVNRQAAFTFSTCSQSE